MREIKFRMYSPMSKKMYYFENTWNSQKPFFQPEYCNMTLSLESEMDDDDRWSMDDDDLEWMQFTGLKDKTGKEIYFGDILCTSNSGEDGNDVWGKEDFGYTVVKESKEELGIDFSNWAIHGSGDEDEVYSRDFVEVIGNIYENPELLTNN